MSGFFKKLRLGKKKPDNDTGSEGKAASEPKPKQDSWSDHEISHEIPEVLESTARMKTPVSSTLELPELSKFNDTLELSLDDMESSIPSDNEVSDDFIEEAMNFDFDSIGDVTAEIQAEIEEQKRVKKLYERRKLILEATDEFRQPNWDDDFLNKGK
jgi:hypothetical protein